MNEMTILLITPKELYKINSFQHSCLMVLLVGHVYTVCRYYLVRVHCVNYITPR